MPKEPAPDRPVHPPEPEPPDPTPGPVKEPPSKPDVYPTQPPKEEPMRMLAADLHREDQLVELELDRCGVAVWSKS